MIQLFLPITLSTLEATKLALTKALPHVKSSHRCEAIARGFGFRTYPSFRAAALAEAGDAVALDGTAFTRYLAEHDFQVPGSALFLAGGKAALAAVASRCPTLTRIGFGVGEWKRGDTAASRLKDFDYYRSELLDDHSAEAFLASLALLQRVKRTKTVRPQTGSYWIKHIAENYTGKYPHGESFGPVYVPNGVLIAAAVHAGFEVRAERDDYGREMLNAEFNMSKTSLQDLDCEIRPEMGWAQDRRRKLQRRAQARTGSISF